MNQWIKCLEGDEIKEFNEKYAIRPSRQRLVGFFRKSPEYVLYCSIVEEPDGTFEYYFNCNKDVAHSFFATKNFKTYQECKEDLIYQITGLSDKQAPMWGLDLDYTTECNEKYWEAMGIKEEYPAWGRVSGMFI